MAPSQLEDPVNRTPLHAPPGRLCEVWNFLWQYIRPCDVADPSQLRRRQFTIERHLGSGNFGEVHIARTPAGSGLPVRVALKTTLKTTEELDSIQKRRWKREERLHARVSDHPHVATLYASSGDDCSNWLAIQLLHGGSVEEAINYARRSGGLGERVAVRIALQVARALAYMHETGVVHRDIKPDNIMLRNRIPRAMADSDVADALLDAECGGEDENEYFNSFSGTRLHAYVVDFGLGNEFDPLNPESAFQLSLSGTAEYRPPKQDLKLHNDMCKGDVYALGVTLYEMVCGERPFNAQHPNGLLLSRDALAALKDRGPTFLEKSWDAVTQGTRTTLAVLLASDEQRRPDMQDVVEMLESLENGLRTVPTSAK